MIRIFLGNVGSGKSLSIIREMVDDETHYFSNIQTKSKGKHALKNNHVIKRDMILHKEVKKIRKDGTVDYEIKFNKDYWLKQKEKYGHFNVVLDEFHTLMEARKFMSKQNRVMGDFLALIRKVCSDSLHESSLTLISQLDSRIDTIARQMATEIRYHVCIYDKSCTKCGAYWTEHSELPDFKKHKRCPQCESNILKKSNYKILIHYFDSIKNYNEWKECNIQSQIQTKLIENIDVYFEYYDTFQMDDLISE